MPDQVSIRRALLSVSDKTDLVPFAAALVDHGVEIVSTGGTASALIDAGVNVIPIDQITGIAEMMGGRVKTLHPSVHGAVLARRDVDSHVHAMREHNMTPIDLVCINLYPFEKTVRQESVTRDEAIEQIDIGGPALLRSAAKNHDFVTVVTNRRQYDRVISQMRQHDGATNLELRRDLAAAAFSRTAEYDTAISSWMCQRREEAFPTVLRLSYGHAGDLRYGENPHQRAAVYKNPTSAEPSVVSADVLHGRELSYNNLHDGAAALELIQDLHDTFPEWSCAAIIKHANPCGAAAAGTLCEAFLQAYAGDPIAAYGGILALGNKVDFETAQAIVDDHRFLEMIMATGFDDAALELLRGRWKNVRILAVSSLGHTTNRKINYKSIPGGMLVQERDMKIASPNQWQHVAGPDPDKPIIRNAAFAWMCAKHLKSNAVSITHNDSLIGIGCGQVDRVTACKLAIEKAGDRLSEENVVAASDAFFPFPDGPQLLIDAGVTCIVHPGGSKRDNETIELCEQRGVTCLLTGVRHFRH